MADLLVESGISTVQFCTDTRSARALYYLAVATG